MTPAVARGELERFRTLVGERLGLQFDDDKLPTLDEVVRERLQTLGLEDFGQYERRAGTREELGRVAERLTVPETYFFRYWDQFRAFRELVFPDRARARAGSAVRILSAGCASGEEAYSLAILSREADPCTPTTVLGVDVSPAMIGRARRGRYSTWSLRATAAEARSQYFHADGRDYRLVEPVVASASFEERNLVDDDPAFWAPDSFDIVFCRNVIMYFAPNVARAVVARIRRALSPGGFLFLGHAETLRGISADFDLRHTHGTFYYQRKDGHGPALAASPPAVATTDSELPPPTDDSWFDTIQQASERVTRLTSGASAALPTGRDQVEAAAAFDVRPVIALLRQERFAEAMELLPEEERAGEAPLLRAVLLAHCGRLRDAEQSCVEILAADAFSSGAHYVIALCREQLGDSVAAVEHDRAAISLDPSFAMPHLHLGLLARRAGNVDEARRGLQRAVALISREDASRVVLFGGGFTREALLDVARAELQAAGGAA
jgi:chemotaxis protein methyltransferase CheR